MDPRRSASRCGDSGCSPCSGSCSASRWPRPRRSSRWRATRSWTACATGCRRPTAAPAASPAARPTPRRSSRRGEVSPSLCIPGRAPVAGAVAELTGKAARRGGGPHRGHDLPRHARPTRATRPSTPGIPTCAAAALVFGGPRACKNGCLGLGDCVRACPFDALSIGHGGIAQVDHAKCTGCAVCVPVCPKDLFSFFPRSRRIELSCKAVDKRGVVRATCMVGCTLCRKCVAKCPAGAIEWDGRTILIDHEKCIAYGPSCYEACVDICPSIILHRVGQLPAPELVELRTHGGVASMASRTPRAGARARNAIAAIPSPLAIAGSGGDGVALVGDLLLQHGRAPGPLRHAGAVLRTADPRRRVRRRAAPRRARRSATRATRPTCCCASGPAT